MHWLYLIIASVLEIGWTFSLKFISFSDLKKISGRNLFSDFNSNFIIILPFLGYVFFGIGNIYFFSLAMKQIPASTAFAVWMAVALAGMKLLEVLVFKASISATDLFCFVLLIIAIIGIKK